MRHLALALILGSLAFAAPAVAEYRYQPGRHADPFAVPALVAPETCQGELCDADLLELKLTALVTGQARNIAMVEDAHGEAHIVRAGQFIGRGRVEAVKSDRVVLVEVRNTDNGPVKVIRELVMK